MSADKFRDVQRWEMYEGAVCGIECSAKMDAAYDGDYVDYSDYLKAVEKIERQAQRIAELETVLRDVELLASINSDINDGSPMHKTIQSILAKKGNAE